MDEQDPREDLVETVFRNGTVTAVGILLAFSLGFITHWAANLIPVADLPSCRRPADPGRHCLADAGALAAARHEMPAAAHL
ncbi:hypothetical protein [Mesorhizobium sp. M7A.F.Ca.MR.148.00.0.0]|uniref:hypothetical protein n=1 Tax=Mesorhizobium sp. M7A.F.Ca.MR.148.00.0.0 TaxID=2496775 RepID=UPI001FDEF417|nr:hypothetical protein [Mesorhizobium sp. M7A.F.Ca.MR.148.00.0.0]